MHIGFIGTGRITRRLVAGAAGQGHSLVVTVGARRSRRRPRGRRGRGIGADMSLDAAIDDLSIEGGPNATLRERLKTSGHYNDLHSGLDALLARLKG